MYTIYILDGELAEYKEPVQLKNKNVKTQFKNIGKKQYLTKSI